MQWKWSLNIIPETRWLVTPHFHTQPYPLCRQCWPKILTQIHPQNWLCSCQESFSFQKRTMSFQMWSLWYSQPQEGWKHQKEWHKDSQQRLLCCHILLETMGRWNQDQVPSGWDNLSWCCSHKRSSQENDKTASRIHWDMLLICPAQSQQHLEPRMTNL